MPKFEIMELNEYRVLLMPEHHRCMSGNWDGYVYEHIVVAEKFLGRKLNDDEVVHHLDGNRRNNRHENLLILNRGQHTKLHNWLQKGAPYKRFDESEPENEQFCKVCGRTLQDKQINYCCKECYHLSSRRVKRPSPSELSKDIKNMSISAIGRKYGVSSTTIKKWILSYRIL